MRQEASAPSTTGRGFVMQCWVAARPVNSGRMLASQASAVIETAG
jgi:hypothetical protein